jgi:hypothetical protein
MIEWLTLFVAISILLNSADLCDGQKCKTDNEGAQKDTLCVFPFQHSGKTYIMCTNENDPDGKLWYWCYKKISSPSADATTDMFFLSAKFEIRG